MRQHLAPHLGSIATVLSANYCYYSCGRHLFRDLLLKVNGIILYVQHCWTTERRLQRVTIKRYISQNRIKFGVRAVA